MQRQISSVLSRSLAVPTCGRIDIISLDTLVRVEAISNYSKLFLSNGKTLVVAKVLKKFEQRLDARQFVRTHKAHLVNLDFIISYCRGAEKKIVLANGETVAVARRKQKYLSQQLQYREAS